MTKTRPPAMRTLATTLLLSPLTLFNAAQAQTAVAESQAVERITVSAQMRDQDSKDVPLAVTAFGAKFMKDNQITDFGNLAQFTPGFVSSPNYGFILYSSIRGISSTEFGFATDPSIAIYVDGVHQGLSGSQANAYFDMARVEVIKGPQATLFGRSSIAGAINAITRKPQAGFGAAASVDIGNFGRASADGFVNVPLRDNLFLRVAAKSEHDDGSVNNISTGDRLGDVDIDAGRVSLRWLATDAIRLDLKFGAESRKQGSNLYQSGLLEGRGYTVDISTNGSDNRSISRIRDAVAELSVDLGNNFSLTANASERRVKNTYQEDYDGIPQIYSGPYLQGQNDRLSQQDLRLTYAADTGLVVNAGVSASRLKRDAFIAEYVDSALLDTFLPPFPEYDILAAPTDLSRALLERGDFRGNFRDSSVYVDASVPLGSGFTATGGARYNRNEKTFSNDVGTELYFLWPYFTSQPIEDNRQWSKTSYRAALSYDISRQHTAYAAYTQGWKAGGFQTLTLADTGCFCDAFAAGSKLAEVKPELADNYEIGIKGNSANGRLRYGLVGFRYTYTGLQKTVQDGLVYSVANVDAGGHGLEAELGWQPDAHWALSTNFGYTSTKVKNDPVDPLQNGLPLNQAPKYTGMLDLAYTTAPISALAGGRVYAGGNLSHRSSFRNNDQLTNGVPGYSLLNLRAGWTAAGGRYSISAYVQNATNRFTFGQYSPASNVFVSPFETRSVFGSPRRFGLVFSANM